MSKFFQTLGRHVKSKNFLFATLGAFAGAFFFTTGSLFDSWQKFSLAMLWSLLIWYSQWFGHGYIAEWLGRRVPWSQQPRKRLILDFVLHVLYAFVAINAVNFFMEWLLSKWITGRPMDFTTEEMLTSGIIAAVISLIISGILTSIGFYTHLKESLSREAELKNQLLSYKYESLRTQLNPHFLFNSLNVLSELVEDDPAHAQTFIHGLSDTYRYVLDAQEREWVSLEDELAFLRTYVGLLEVRFESGLKVEMDVPYEANDRVVPLALQLLVENAVKHNVVSMSKPLRVVVRREGDTLQVTNPIRPKQHPAPSRKLGLENLRQRYAFFPQAEVVVETENSQFTVTIPVLQAATKSDEE